MPQKHNGIRFLEGSTDILLIAPHGPVIDNTPRNDENTGIMVEYIRKSLSCSAVINDVYLKPDADNEESLENRRLDFNKTGQALKHPAFIEYIRRVIDAPGNTMVVWLHGMCDKNALSEENSHRKLNLLKKGQEELHALIGYGQGRDQWAGSGGSRYTASRNVVEEFRDLLSDNGMTTLIARENAENYRGRHPGRMNQWFLNQNYGLDKVQSIQMEIRYTGCRDTDENITKASGIISNALSLLLRAEAR